MGKSKFLILSFFCASFLCHSYFISSLQAGHTGEQRMLDVGITFSGQFGNTVANALGIDYHVWGMVSHEDKVYPSQYWGNFPLYFFDSLVGVTVTVTNKGPRERAKIRIQTESFVLLTDGSNGVQLSPAKIIDVDVNKGETKTIDASFVVNYTPGADSGLDRFVVKVLHQNEGQGNANNPEPSLIMVKEGIFCPPKYVKR